jgi:cytidine deaminase
MNRAKTHGASRSAAKTPAELAMWAAGRAHAPYSGFRVGAVLEDEEGLLHAGCNLEIASIGLSLCAERVALGAAVACGAMRFTRLWIYTPTRVPTPPCGACREMLTRFSDNLSVIMLCDRGAPHRARLNALLPASRQARRPRS